MDQNSKKWSQKGYHSLPFAVKVSVRRSFEQFCVVWISDKEAFRIIQSHHVIKHAVFKQSKGFLTACRNTAAYCIFLPFGTPDPGSKFRRYQLFIKFLLEWRRGAGCRNQSGMFEGVTTIFIFIIIPFKYALLTKCEVVNMTGYMAKFLFFAFC